MSRLRADGGVVGGVEVLAFGALVFVAGTLLVANAWGAVDAKAATASAAREAVRAYVEQDGAGDAEAAAHRAAEDAFEGYGRDPTRMTLTLTIDIFRRCARLTAEVTYRVPIVDLPFLAEAGDAYEVRSRASEIVDPYRSDLEGPADCG